MAIDRRVQRTRTALYDGLVQLIRVKPYGAISVDDILRQADVGRSTFYAHFRSKDELLERSLDRLKHLLLTTIAERTGGQEPSFWLCSDVLFAHLAEYRDIHNALVEGAGGEVLHAALSRVVSEVLGATLPPATGGVPRDLVLAFVTASFTAVLAWWLQRHPERSAEEAEALFRSLVGNGSGVEIGDEPNAFDRG